MGFSYESLKSKNYYWNSNGNKVEEVFTNFFIKPKVGFLFDIISREKFMLSTSVYGIYEFRSGHTKYNDGLTDTKWTRASLGIGAFLEMSFLPSSKVAIKIGLPFEFLASISETDTAKLKTFTLAPYLGAAYCF